MLSPTADTLRLVLHLLAASIWVGGQVVLGGLVPSLRRVHPEATKVAARAFARVAWPAFAIVSVTGLWSLAEIDLTGASSGYQVTMLIKIALAMGSGAAAAVHALGRTRLALALGGALGLLGAVGALALGVLLGTGT
jgi:putative copper export protein